MCDDYDGKSVQGLEKRREDICGRKLNCSYTKMAYSTRILPRPPSPSLLLPSPPQQKKDHNYAVVRVPKQQKDKVHAELINEAEQSLAVMFTARAMKESEALEPDWLIRPELIPVCVA